MVTTPDGVANIALWYCLAKDRPLIDNRPVDPDTKY